MSSLFVIISLIATYPYANRYYENSTITTSTTKNSPNLINYSSPSQYEIQDGSATKNSSINNSQSNNTTVTTDTTKSSTRMIITALSQNGSTLQIRVQINTIEDTGVCTLTLLKSGSNSVEKSVSSQTLANTSTCKGFDIPTTELSPGTWQATITYDSSKHSGSIAKEVVIN